MAVFRRFGGLALFGIRIQYSALFCRILKILGKITLAPCKLTGYLVDDLTSAVEAFNRVSSDSRVGLKGRVEFGCIVLGVEVAFLEWGQAPKPPSFVALRATTQSTRWSLI